MTRVTDISDRLMLLIYDIVDNTDLNTTDLLTLLVY